MSTSALRPLLAILALSGCRPEGQYAICADREPPPCQPAQGATTTESDTGQASCPGPADRDEDGWQDAAEGGRDCDDADPDVGDCNTGDTGNPAEDCVATGEDACNGVDDDCDGLVDDSFVVTVTAEGTAVVSGAFLAEGEVGLAIGVDGADGHGAVDVYDAAGTLIVRIDGTDQSASFGSQLATGRDLTGDGVVDLVIAAPSAETADGPNSGRVFVLAGPLGEESTLADAVGWFEGGELDGQPGAQLAVLPNLSGDGRAELAIGYYRHTLLFSGAPAPAARRADALSDLEVNTGGGPWHYALGADEDTDGRPEFLLGMETYDGGAGLVAVVHSSDLSRIASQLTDPAWPGLGSKLVTVAGSTWSLSGTTPVRLGDFSALPYAATSLANAGDLDGDGVDELLVVTDDGFVALRSDGSLLGMSPIVADVQSNRDAAAAIDLGGDGIPDPVLLDADRVAALSGATAFSSPCDGDGDGVSAAAGDCDDANAAVFPGAPESCNGADDDCDGAVDTPVDIDVPSLSEGAVLAGFVATTGRTEDDTVTPGDGWLLDSEGTALGFGEWQGVSMTGLRPLGPGNGGANALSWGGDLAGTGAAYLLGHAGAVDLVLPTDRSGDAVAVSQARIHDGTGLTRNGTMASVGDIDGDGTIEAAFGFVDPIGQPSLALFSAALADDPTADDADWLIALPDGWARWTLATAASPEGGDLDDDGLADLIVGSAASYYEQGRVTLIARPPAGAAESDDLALLQLYGEPDEGLGGQIALGDVTGDGVDDAVLTDETGVRVLRGASCPVLDDRLTAPSTWLALYDGDGDGQAEIWTGTPTAGLSRGGSPLRDAVTLFGASAGGLLYADDGVTRALRPACDP